MSQSASPCNRDFTGLSFADGLKRLYRVLINNFGPQNWWPGDTAFEVMVGAILTQAVSSENVERAIRNLKEEEILNPKALKKVSEAKLARLIKPAGYYNMKAKKLKTQQ